MKMLLFEDFQEVQSQIDTLDTLFTADIAAKGETYELTYDEPSGQFVLTVFDANDAPIGSAKISDPQVAIAYMQKLFQLDPVDPACVNPAGQANGTRWGQGAAVGTQVSQDADIDGTDTSASS